MHHLPESEDFSPDQASDVVFLPSVCRIMIRINLGIDYIE